MCCSQFPLARAETQRVYSDVRKSHNKRTMQEYSEALHLFT